MPRGAWCSIRSSDRGPARPRRADDQQPAGQVGGHLLGAVAAAPDRDGPRRGAGAELGDPGGQRRQAQGGPGGRGVAVGDPRVSGREGDVTRRAVRLSHAPARGKGRGGRPGGVLVGPEPHPGPRQRAQVAGRAGARERHSRGAQRVERPLAHRARQRGQRAQDPCDVVDEEHRAARARGGLGQALDQPQREAWVVRPDHRPAAGGRRLGPGPARAVQHVHVPPGAQGRLRHGAQRGRAARAGRAGEQQRPPRRQPGQGGGPLLGGQVDQTEHEGAGRGRQRPGAGLVALVRAGGRVAGPAHQVGDLVEGAPLGQARAPQGPRARPARPGARDRGRHRPDVVGGGPAGRTRATAGPRSARRRSAAARPTPSARPRPAGRRGAARHGRAGPARWPPRRRCRSRPSSRSGP